MALNDIQVEDLINRFRQIVREEISNSLKVEHDKNIQNPYDEWGGKPLAREVTGLSYSTIYKNLHRIPHSKKGGKLFFNRGQLLDFIKNGQRIQEGGVK